MAILKQSTAYVRAFLMVSSADHITGKTAASPVVTISKNGAAFAAAAGAIAELSNGWYTVSFTNVDSNTLGDLAVHATGSGADPSDWTDQVCLDVPGATVTQVTGSVASVTAGGLAQADLDKVFGASGAAMAELAQAAPSATPNAYQALMLLYMALRNQSTTTASTYTIRNDAGTVICKSTVSDDGTTFTRAELVSGP